MTVATESRLRVTATEITKRIVERAVRLQFTRCSLDTINTGDDPLDEDDMVRDAINLALGDDTGCLSDEDLTAENIDLLFVEQQLAKFAGTSGTWTQDAPTEQAWYWHWNGSPDASPFIYSVLVSGANGKCFISNSSRSSAPWCEDVGGWWMKIEPPALPVLVG
jgi:hypothetical protein